ncbi:MAG: hypothetical protein V3R29_10780 [Candidatus Acidoferrales bacterium]
MKFLPLSVACPNCGSRNVTYTCEPKCCFNHLCNACYTSFMLGTEKLGRELPTTKREGLPPEGPEDALAACVGCQRCESIAVYQLERELDGATHVCGACFALLKCTIEDVVQN